MYHCLLLLAARELVVFLYRSVFTFSEKKNWGVMAPPAPPLATAVVYALGGFARHAGLSFTDL